MGVGFSDLLVNAEVPGGTSAAEVARRAQESRLQVVQGSVVVEEIGRSCNIAPFSKRHVARFGIELGGCREKGTKWLFNIK